VIPSRGGLALGCEHGRCQHERAAVDRRIAEVLRERDRVLLLEPNARPLRPGDRFRRVVHEHRGTTRPHQRNERPIAEHVVGGDDDEDRLIGQDRLRCRERRAVPVLPPFRENGPHASRRDPVDDGGNGAGLVPHDDDDLLEPEAQQAPDGTLDQRQTANADQRLRSPASHASEPLGASGGEDHSHVRRRKHVIGGDRHTRIVRLSPGSRPRHRYLQKGDQPHRRETLRDGARRNSLLRSRPLSVPPGPESRSSKSRWLEGLPIRILGSRSE
jgi:hypothetical protein